MKIRPKDMLLEPANNEDLLKYPRDMMEIEEEAQKAFKTRELREEYLESIKNKKERKIILQEERTLEDVLLNITKLHPNGCTVNFIIEGRKVYIKYGCHGFTAFFSFSGDEKLFIDWFEENKDDKERVRVDHIIHPKILAELRKRVYQCPVCGGEVYSM